MKICCLTITIFFCACQDKESNSNVQPTCQKFIEDGVTFRIFARDGSIIRGEIDLKEFELRTEHGMLKFLCGKVKSIIMGNVKNEKMDVVMTTDEKSNTFNGWLKLDKEIVVKTAHGILKVPPKEIVSITAPGKPPFVLESDEQVFCDGEESIALTNLYGSWVSIEGAKWIATNTFSDSKQVVSSVFLKYFDISDQVDIEEIEGKIITAVDNRAKYYLNGELVGQLNDGTHTHYFQSVHTFQLKGLRRGINELLVEAFNDGGPGGLIFKIEIKKKDK